MLITVVIFKPIKGFPTSQAHRQNIRVRFELHSLMPFTSHPLERGQCYMEIKDHTGQSNSSLHPYLVHAGWSKACVFSDILRLWSLHKNCHQELLWQNAKLRPLKHLSHRDTWGHCKLPAIENSFSQEWLFFGRGQWSSWAPRLELLRWAGLWGARGVRVSDGAHCFLKVLQDREWL